MQQDASELAALNDMINRTPNALLSASADCGQLKEWRQGRRPYLRNRASYQIIARARAAPAPPGIIRGVCDLIRAEGREKKLPDVMQKARAAIEQVLSHIRLNELTRLGVADEDEQTCYGPGLVKMSRDDREVIDASMVALALIKNRVLVYVLSAPYTNEQTIPDLLVKHRANVAALRAANQ